MPPFGPPSILIGTTTNYVKICDDYLCFWQPTPTKPKTYPLSSFLTPLKSSNPPITPSLTISVSVDDAGMPLLVDPLRYVPIWTDPRSDWEDSWKTMNQTIWAPIPPDDYVALGVVVTAAKRGSKPPEPAKDLVQCLRWDFSAPGKTGEPIFGEDLYFFKRDNPVCIMPIERSNAMFAQAGSRPDPVAVFIPKGLPQQLSDVQHLARLEHEPLIITAE